MSKKDSTETMNMVFLAGRIQSIKMRENDGFILVDVGEKTKFLPCTIYQSKQLAELAARFDKGDFIKLVGFARGWSQKKDDGVWVNHVDIRITEIKNAPPERKQSKRTAVEANNGDYPF